MTTRFKHILGMIFIVLIVLTLTTGVTLTAARRLESQAGELAANRAPPCSINVIVGQWGWRATGKTPDGFDVVGAGTFSVAGDGKSNFHGWTYVNRSGFVLVEVSDSGTTTVNPDCTGTQVWSGRPDDPAKFIIMRNGSEIWAVYTKRFSTVTLTRIGGLPGQASSPCSIATIVGEWGWRATGKTPDGFDVVGAGTFSVAGDGKSSSRGWTYVNRPGFVLAEVSGSGTTTVNPDCVGTQVWSETPDDPAKFIIMRDGSEVWAVYTKRFIAVSLTRIGGLPGRTASVAFPKGTYTTELTRADIPSSFPSQIATVLVGRWETTFAEDGRHVVAKDGEVVVTGKYAATRNQVAFYGDKGPLACDIQQGDTRPFLPPATPAAARSGTYNWVFDGSVLMFTKVADECAGRVVLFTAHPLIKRR